MIKLLKPIRVGTYARVSREFNESFKVKLKPKIPKNTLRAKFLGRKSGLNGDDFVMDMISVVDTWEVIKFKRVKKKHVK